MKYLKKFGLFEKEFSQDYFEKNPSFYLSKAKKTTEMIKRMNALLNNLDMSEVRFEKKYGREYEIIFPESFNNDTLELTKELAANGNMVDIPNKITLDEYIAVLRYGYKPCHSVPELFSNRLLAHFMEQTGSMLELTDEQIDYLEKHHQKFMFLHTSSELYALPATSFEIHRAELEKKIRLYKKVSMSKNLETLIDTDHINYERTSSASLMDIARDMLRKVSVSEIEVEYFAEQKKYDIYHIILPREIKRFILDNFRNKASEIYFSVERNNLNRVHTDAGLAKEFTGIGLGFKQYKALLNKLGWLRTDYKESVHASQNVWVSLSTDSDYYVMRTTDTDNTSVIAICKSLSEAKIRDIVEQCKTLGELEYDERLDSMLGNR
jgi:hypothetical protein